MHYLYVHTCVYSPLVVSCGHVANFCGGVCRLRITLNFAWNNSKICYMLTFIIGLSVKKTHFLIRLSEKVSTLSFEGYRMR